MCRYLRVTNESAASHCIAGSSSSASMASGDVAAINRFTVRPGRGGVDRPRALLLPEVHPVLDRVGLCRVEPQAVRERRFGRRVLAPRFLQSSEVIQRDRREGDRVGLPLHRRFGHAQPVPGGIGILLLAFGDQAGVDAGLLQPRIEREGVPIRGRRTVEVAHVGAQYAEIEQRGAPRGRVVAGDPGLVGPRGVLQATRGAGRVGPFDDLFESEHQGVWWAYGSAYANKALPAAIATYCLPLTA